MKKIKLSPNSKEGLHLCSVDKKLGKIINKIGNHDVVLFKDEYLSLINFIIGQQLSEKAASTIFQRLKTAINELIPQNVIDADENIFKAAGISRNKTIYIKDLSHKIINKELNFKTLMKEEDSVIIKKLTEIKGIGTWTAEMFLIFTLGKIDIISYQDIGLQRSIKWLYKLDDYPDSELMLKISNKWKPYRTIASLYLWEIINRGIIHE